MIQSLTQSFRFWIDHLFCMSKDVYEFGGLNLIAQI